MKSLCTGIDTMSCLTMPLSVLINRSPAVDSHAVTANRRLLSTLHVNPSEQITGCKRHSCLKYTIVCMAVPGYILQTWSRMQRIFGIKCERISITTIVILKNQSTAGDCTEYTLTCLDMRLSVMAFGIAQLFLCCCAVSPLPLLSPFLPPFPCHKTTPLLLWDQKDGCCKWRCCDGHLHRWTALSASVPAHSNTSRHPGGGKRRGQAERASSVGLFRPHVHTGSSWHR